MDNRMQFPTCVMAVLLLLSSSLVSVRSTANETGADTSNGGRGFIAAYWGSGDDVGVEGSLASACLSGNYHVVIIAFVADFGNFQTPQLILSRCEGSSCAYLSSDIHTCQENGIKVLLSLGGGSGNYGFTSDADAANMADYVWRNYLGGHSDSRPLGAAQVDGIDLDIEQGSSAHYAHFAVTLRNLAKGWHKHLYLSAAPQCPFPDAWDGPGTGTALQTGLFDYVFVQFYNNYCQFQGSTDDVVSAWNQWTQALPKSLIFLGLPASPQAAGSGYVNPADAVNTLLPAIKSQGGNYGGVMLWSVYDDNTQNPRYSKSISSGL